MDKTLKLEAKWIALIVAALASLAVCGVLFGFAPSALAVDKADDAAVEAEGDEADDKDAKAAEEDTDVSELADELKNGKTSKEVEEFSSLLESDEADSKGSSSDVPSGMQLIGSQKVGYLLVPDTWEDRIDDMDPQIVADYGMTYYVDPDSEYTSVVQEHYAFSKAIQMTVQPTSYMEIAQGIIEMYQEDTDRFGETTYGAVELGGRDAVVIVTSVPDDNVLMCTIVIDRDGDGHAAVALTSNCGASERQAEEVLAYLATWTY